MKEILELRVNQAYAHLLFKDEEGVNLGNSIKVVELPKDDPRYSQVPSIDQLVKEKYNQSFFYGWKIKRTYTKAELDSAILFHLKIKSTFGPAGEECGTVYDENTSCEICGSNRKQLSSLILKKDSIPRKDIARTIAGEIVVSEKFVQASTYWGLKGLILDPIQYGNLKSSYSQLKASSEIALSQNTIVGVNPYDFSEKSEGEDFTIQSEYRVHLEKEIYRCPMGHTIGLNLISEPHVLKNSFDKEVDFLASKQKIGVKRGLLRPIPLYIVTQSFRKMVVEQKLIGFEFEIANIE